MKKIILLFFIAILILGCSSDDIDPFYGFKVENTTGIEIKSIKKTQVLNSNDLHQTSTKTALYGVKDGKIWISIFDNSTKEKIYEYTYKEKIPTTINRPFGKAFNVASFRVKAHECGELMIISGEYLNYVPQDGILYPNIDDSILNFDGVLISKNGNTRITSLIAYPWYESSIICKVDKENIIFGQSGEQLATIKYLPENEYIPLSFTHGILINNNSFYSFVNYSTGMRINTEIQEVTNLVKEGITDYKHIVNEIRDSNSSFANIDFHITLITGEVSNYTLKIDMTDGNYQWLKAN